MKSWTSRVVVVVLLWTESVFVSNAWLLRNNNNNYNHHHRRTPTRPTTAVLVVGTSLSSSSSSSSSNDNNEGITTIMTDQEVRTNNVQAHPPPKITMTRPDLLSSRRTTLGRVVAGGASMLAMMTTTATSTTNSMIPPAWAVEAQSDNNNKQQQQQEEEEELTVYQTPTGLKYIDFVTGVGPTPAYGQLVSIAYTAYIKLPTTAANPNAAPVLFERDAGYLIKHGNGKIVPGLDEGIHTMRVGGKRRILIPPKLGYIESGLGPIPAYPWDRWRLNDLLESMIQVKGGTLIFEVQLLAIKDDEADQGYYQDDALSPEDFDTLRTNIQRKVQENMAAARQQQQQQI